MTYQRRKKLNALADQLVTPQRYNNPLSGDWAQAEDIFPWTTSSTVSYYPDNAVSVLRNKRIRTFGRRPSWHPR